VNEPRTIAIRLPNGDTVRADELDGSAPGYVYVHGLGSVRTGTKSDSLLHYARDRGRAFVRYDQRGHGESSGTIGAVTITELITDALVVARRQPSCILVGSSLGGLVAAFASALVPERVRALCLIAPAIGLATDLRGRLDADGCMQTSNGLRFPVLRHVLDDAKNLGEERLASRIVVPTLIVHGTKDDVVPWRASERFHAAIPTAKKDLWIVDGGDHRLADHGPAMWRRLERLLDDAP